MKNHPHLYETCFLKIMKISKKNGSVNSRLAVILIIGQGKAFYRQGVSESISLEFQSVLLT